MASESSNINSVFQSISNLALYATAEQKTELFAEGEGMKSSIISVQTHKEFIATLPTHEVNFDLFNGLFDEQASVMEYALKQFPHLFDEVPEEFEDCVSRELMIRPTMHVCGDVVHHFDETSIVTCTQERRQMCPVTRNALLENEELVRDFALQSRIYDYVLQKIGEVSMQGAALPSLPVPSPFPELASSAITGLSEQPVNEPTALAECASLHYGDVIGVGQLVESVMPGALSWSSNDPAVRLRMILNLIEYHIEGRINHPTFGSVDQHDVNGEGCSTCAGSIGKQMQQGVLNWASAESFLKLTVESLPQPIKETLYAMMSGMNQSHHASLPGGEQALGRETFFWNLHKASAVVRSAIMLHDPNTEIATVDPVVLRSQPVLPIL